MNIPTLVGVIFTPLNPLQITLYLSYPMTTMERMEMVPKTPPVKAYTLHPALTKLLANQYRVHW